MFMKMKKILFLLSVILYFVSQLQAQTVHAKLGGYPIGIWNDGWSYRKSDFTDFVSTNINFIHIKTSRHTNREILNICDTSVLKVLIDNNRFDFSQDTFAYSHNAGINFLDSLGHHPSILGYLYIDEPEIWTLHKITPFSQEIRNFDSTFAHTANLLPMYAAKYRIAENINDSSISADSESYSAYIDSFVAICNPTFLMFDHYPIMNDYKRRSPSLWPRDFFINLDIMSYKSEEYNLPFLYVASLLDSITYEDETHDTIYYQIHAKDSIEFNYVLNSALVYGAKGFVYWCNCYWNLLTAENKAYLSWFNKKIFDNSQVLLSLHFRSAYHKSFVSTLKPACTETIPSHSSWNNFSNDTNASQIFNVSNPLQAVNNSSIDSIVVSFLVDSAGCKYFWVFNKSLFSTETIALNLINGCNVFDVFANDYCGNSNQVEITLGPCDAKLFKTNVYDNGNQYVKIDTNTLWNTKKYITTNIIIPNNVTLTITDTIAFSNNAKMIVHPGGRLNISGGVLLSSCDNSLWQGIEVWGTPDAAQYSGIRAVTSPQQGEVVLNNAVIKNAVCGVRVGKLNSRNQGKGGGVIKASYSQFVNNKKAVHFNPYSHVNVFNRVTDNVSYFHHCTFSVDDDAYFTVDTSNVQVALHNVTGVQFRGCNFEDMQTKTSWTDMGTALYACNAGFRINEQTDIFQYPATYHDTACVFYNYKNAIAIVGSAEKPVRIYNTDFSNNSTGVNAKNADALSILSCSFSSGSISYSSDIHGLILDSCNLYRIENNIFMGIGNGIKIIGKTEDNNTIRLNTFDQLCRAIEVYGNNGNSPENINATSVELKGLQFECNDFIMDSTDIYVAPQTFIKRSQGCLGKACGNYLGDQSILHFNNRNSQNHLFYFYNINVNEQIPIRYNYLDILSTTSDICGERHGYIGDSYYNMTKTILDFEYVYNIDYQLYEITLDNYLSTYEGISIDWDNITSLTDMSDPQIYDLLQLSELKNRLDETCIKAIHLLGNATEVEITEITTWLQRLSSLDADLLSIHYLSLSEDVSLVQSSWDQIVQHYSIVNPEDTSYYQYCINQIQAWARDTASDVNISQGAIDTLTAIVNGNNTASPYAVSVLECINEHYPWWKLRIHTSCNWTLPIESMSPKKETDQRKIDAIQLHPNPTNGMIEIKSNNLNIKQIELYDIFGKLLMEKKANESTVTLDVSPYAKGMYLLRYTLSDDTQQTKKIIKE